MIGEIILLLIAVCILVVIVRKLPSLKSIKSLGGLIMNAILGIGLLLVANLINLTQIPVDIITILVCALGGIPGSLILIVLNILGYYPNLPLGF